MIRAAYVIEPDFSDIFTYPTALMSGPITDIALAKDGTAIPEGWSEAHGMDGQVAHLNGYRLIVTRDKNAPLLTDLQVVLDSERAEAMPPGDVVHSQRLHRTNEFALPLPIASGLPYQLLASAYSSCKLTYRLIPRDHHLQHALNTFTEVESEHESSSTSLPIADLIVGNKTSHQAPPTYQQVSRRSGGLSSSSAFEKGCIFFVRHLPAADYRSNAGWHIPLRHKAVSFRIEDCNVLRDETADTIANYLFPMGISISKEKTAAVFRSFWFMTDEAKKMFGFAFVCSRILQFTCPDDAVCPPKYAHEAIILLSDEDAPGPMFGLLKHLLTNHATTDGIRQLLSSTPMGHSSTTPVLLLLSWMLKSQAIPNISAQEVLRLHFPAVLVPVMSSYTKPDNAMPGVPHTHVQAFLKHITPSMFTQLLALLLHEEKVVIVSRDVSILPSIFLVVLQLLYPLQWQHITMPIVPATLIDILHSPVPFFVGLHADLLPDLRSLPPEINVVNVDESNVWSVATANKPQRRDSRSATAHEMCFLVSPKAVIPTPMRGIVRHADVKQSLLERKPGVQLRLQANEPRVLPPRVQDYLWRRYEQCRAKVTTAASSSTALAAELSDMCCRAIAYLFSGYRAHIVWHPTERFKRSASSRAVSQQHLLLPPLRIDTPTSPKMKRIMPSQLLNSSSYDKVFVFDPQDFLRCKPAQDRAFLLKMMEGQLFDSFLKQRAMVSVTHYPVPSQYFQKFEQPDEALPRHVHDSFRRSKSSGDLTESTRLEPTKKTLFSTDPTIVRRIMCFDAMIDVLRQAPGNAGFGPDETQLLEIIMKKPPTDRGVSLVKPRAATSGDPAPSTRAWESKSGQVWDVYLDKIFTQSARYNAELQARIPASVKSALPSPPEPAHMISAYHLMVSFSIILKKVANSSAYDNSSTGSALSEKRSAWLTALQVYITWFTQIPHLCGASIVNDLMNCLESFINLFQWSSFSESASKWEINRLFCKGIAIAMSEFQAQMQDEGSVSPHDTHRMLNIMVRLTSVLETPLHVPEQEAAVMACVLALRRIISAVPHTRDNAPSNGVDGHLMGSQALVSLWPALVCPTCYVEGSPEVSYAATQSMREPPVNDLSALTGAPVHRTCFFCDEQLCPGLMIAMANLQGGRVTVAASPLSLSNTADMPEAQTTWSSFWWFARLWLPLPNEVISQLLHTQITMDDVEFSSHGTAAISRMIGRLQDLKLDGQLPPSWTDYSEQFLLPDLTKSLQVNDKLHPLIGFLSAKAIPQAVQYFFARRQEWNEMNRHASDKRHASMTAIPSDQMSGLWDCSCYATLRVIAQLHCPWLLQASPDSAGKLVFTQHAASAQHSASIYQSFGYVGTRGTACFPVRRPPMRMDVEISPAEGGIAVSSEASAEAALSTGSRMSASSAVQGLLSKAWKKLRRVSEPSLPSVKADTPRSPAQAITPMTPSLNTDGTFEAAVGDALVRILDRQAMTGHAVLVRADDWPQNVGEFVFEDRFGRLGI